MEETAASPGLTEILEGLCPRGLGWSAGSAGSLAALPLDRVQVSGWSSARANEFTGGRACARQALGMAGLREEAVLERDSAGLPGWPAGFTGSITHCRGMCMAVAGPMSTFSVLGLDLERTDRIGEGAASRVAHPQERRFWGGDQSRASVLFSLKEAFYKAQYPRWGLQAGFGDMALEVDMAGGSARIAFLADHLSEGMTGAGRGDFHFRFALAGSHVVSLCWVPA